MVLMVVNCVSTMMNYSNHDFINILNENKKMLMPTNGKGLVSLSLLQHYFPGAKGLTYESEDEVHFVDIKNGQLCVMENKNYQVYIASKGTTHTMTENKSKDEERIRYVMNEIRRKKSTSGTKISTVKAASNVSTKSSTFRTVRVGWFHKSDRGNKYYQIRNSAGGNRVLKLDSKKRYSVEDIVSCMKTMFLNEENCKIAGLPSTTNLFECRLGYFGGHFIDAFKTTDGNLCDFWTFCESIGLTPYKTNLYLYTNLSVIKHAVTSSNMVPQQYNRSSNSRCESEITDEFIDTFVDQVPQERNMSLNLHQNVTTFPYLESEITDDESESGTYADKITEKSSMSVNLNSNLANSSNSRSEISDEDYIYTSNDNVEIMDHDIKISKYTHSWSISEKSKFDIFISLPDTDYISFAQFDPVDNGYNISEIRKDSTTLLKISYTDDNKRVFSFPAYAEKIVQHSILYNTDELCGTYGGKPGLGIIPACSDLCQPVFTWYKNGTVFKTGPFLYWIWTDEESAYSCTITCSPENELSSYKTKLTKQFNEILEKVVTVNDCFKVKKMLVSLSNSLYNYVDREKLFFRESAFF